MAGGAKRICGFGVMQDPPTTPAPAKVKINADTYFCRACVRRSITQLHKRPGVANRPMLPQLQARMRRDDLDSARIFFGITPQKAGPTQLHGCHSRFTRTIRRDRFSRGLAAPRVSAPAVKRKRRRVMRRRGTNPLSVCCSSDAELAPEQLVDHLRIGLAAR